ncbi:hypothetical protein NQ315_014973 [Exocentrus adspersus]|uniref:Uncharacterized protein n=1 Tax=Exocentrus adspersus TaxID=1586481 RepID=A0AAV8V5U5_9CUCU|nr:hypothetical protein NQ315_014973 [Exocentrus adspersus]
MVRGHITLRPLQRIYPLECIDTHTPAEQNTGKSDSSFTDIEGKERIHFRRKRNFSKTRIVCFLSRKPEPSMYWELKEEEIL